MCLVKEPDNFFSQPSYLGYFVFIGWFRLSKRPTHLSARFGGADPLARCIDGPTCSFVCHCLEKIVAAAFGGKLNTTISSHARQIPSHSTLLAGVQGKVIDQAFGHACVVCDSFVVVLMVQQGVSGANAEEMLYWMHFVTHQNTTISLSRPSNRTPLPVLVTYWYSHSPSIVGAFFVLVFCCTDCEACSV